jgi:ornithine carbamoyltransferase
MWQRFTERARRVVFFAQEEAARLGENYVGTEHLLLGLVRESDSVAARILDRMGVPLGRLREDIERQVTRGAGSLGQDMQLTPRAKRVIDLAYEEARQLNNNYIGTEHILLGLIREGDGLAARVLVKQGADLERTRREVYEMQEGDPKRASGRDEPGTQNRLDAFRDRLSHLGRFVTDLEREWISIRRREVEPPAEAAAGAEAGAEAGADDDPAGAAHDQLRELVTNLPAAPGLETRSLREGLRWARAACAGLSDFVSVSDLDWRKADALLQLSVLMKRAGAQPFTGQESMLAGRSLAMIFEKASLRTRVSFEAGMFQLGGQAVHLAPAEIGLGKRESVGDVAQVLGRWVQGIAARTHRHETIQELAASTPVPVINALSDQEHPCQALADFMTLRERCGQLEGLKLAYVGDCNNVANSLILLAAKMGVHLTIACPEGYEPAPALLEAARPDQERSGSRIEVVRDPAAAAAEADAIYTDVWTSMGQELEESSRARVFEPYQINAGLLARAKPEAIVLHCLPAHRGQEITDEVIDGPQSVVFDQAENRLHTQKALLAVLLS